MIMTFEEIKEIIRLSGGKVIVREEKTGEGYVIMPLKSYLDELRRNSQGQKTFNKEQGTIKRKEEEDSASQTNKEKLTNEKLLDRINTDINELYRRKKAEETASALEEEPKAEEELNYEQV